MTRPLQLKAITSAKKSDECHTTERSFVRLSERAVRSSELSRGTPDSLSSFGHHSFICIQGRAGTAIE